MMIQKFSIAALLTILAASLSGCGPNLVRDENSPNQMGSNSFYFGQSTDSNYSCSGSESILPVDDRVLDGTQRYSACTNRTSVSKVKIVGYSSSSRWICALPVQYLNSTQFIYRLNQYGQVIYSCYDGWGTNNDNATEVDFTGTTFNGLILVDQASIAPMTACLTGAVNCPPHSIGQFRQ